MKRRPHNMADKIVSRRGIEVGHIFYFGDQVFASRWARWCAGPDGEPVPLEMGTYGIGVSRLVGALIEANHDEAGIIWPESVAPFRVGLINLRASDARCRTGADDLYGKLRNAGIEVLYDDGDELPGAKFATMDLDRPARADRHWPARPRRRHRRSKGPSLGRAPRCADRGGAQSVDGIVTVKTEDTAGQASFDMANSAPRAHRLAVRRVHFAKGRSPARRPDKARPRREGAPLGARRPSRFGRCRALSGAT